MDAYENDSHNGSFEEGSFVDDSFDINEEVIRKARNSFSNIIDKYVCLSHGLASPAFIADRAIEMCVPKRSLGRKISVEKSQNIISEQITSKESLECENPIQEEIERTLLKRKQELGLPDDYVSEELQLGNGIKVSDIGSGDKGEDGNTGMFFKKSARLKERSGFKKENKLEDEITIKGKNMLEKSLILDTRKQEADKELQKRRGWKKTKLSAISEIGKQEMEGGIKENESNRKQEKEKELQEKKPRGRPRRFTASEIEKQEVEGEIKVKKSRGRPRKSTSSKMSKQEAEGETKAKKPYRRPRKSTASEIEKQEIDEETKAKKPRGRPTKSNTSELFNNKRKRELLKKIKESSGKPRQSTGYEVNKKKTEKKSRLSKINVSESDKYETEQELREDCGKPKKDSRCEGPKMIKRKRGRPKKNVNKLKSSSFHSRQNKKIDTHKLSFSELYAKSSQKSKSSSDDVQRPFRVDGMNTVARNANSADNNCKAVWDKSVSRYFKHLGVGKEQGHISLCPSLDLIIVPPLKKDDCLVRSSFPLPRKVLFAIPFISKSTVSEKDIDEGVAQKSRSDCTLKTTSFGGSVKNDASSKVPHIKEKVINKRSSQENSCRGHSNKNISENCEEHSCKHQKLLKYKRNLSNIKHSVPANEISEKSQTVNLKDDVQPVLDCEYQLKDKEPQDHGNIDACRQQKGKDTRLLENKNVLYSNENSTSGKDGAQMVSKMEKVQLDQNYGDPTKQRQQKSKEKHSFCSENLLNDENHNRKELDMLTTRVVSPVVECASSNRNKEQCLSPEEECEVKCNEEKHSSAYKRKGKRPRKFFKGSRNIRCSKRKKLEAPLYPSTSFTGPAKSRKLDSKKRERKFSRNSPPNKDCSNVVNRSLADVFQYSDDESNCEGSLNSVSEDCQSAFIDGKMPKRAKDFVVSDCTKTDEHTKVNVSNSCSRNSRLELMKSFRNENCSLKLNTEVENNSRIVAQDLKNDSNKESTKNSTTSLPEKRSGSGKKKEKFQVVMGNHEESVVAGIDVVKKKRINIVARNKVTVHSNQYISSIMPGEETCPSGMNSCAAEPLENGDHGSVSAGAHMQEGTLKKMPKKDAMSQLEANEDEDSDGFQDSLSLLPVEKSPVSVGSCHSSLFHFLKLRKLLPQNVSKCAGESVLLRPENNTSTGANFAEKSTSVQSKVPSFFDISDDEDHLMDLLSSVEADRIIDLPSRVRSSFSKNRSIGVSFQKKGSKQVPQQHNFMYKGKVVDIMKFL